MPAGLYIHYPFCRKKCYYCDFVSTPHLEAREGYLTDLIHEYSLYSNEWKPVQFNTLYIGGGTPSLVLNHDWTLLGSWVEQTFPDIQEFTIEANPESVTEVFLQQIKKAGCNRISLGIQSMDNHCLSASGRIHTAKEAVQSYEKALAYHFPAISVDFILGLPGESDHTIQMNLAFLEKAHPQHISLYFLSFPECSEILSLYQKNPSLFPGEETILHRWEQYIQFFTKMGYEHYEISNFSLPGFASRHNSHYWNFDAYLGLGVSASSFNHTHRWTNCSTLETYSEKINLSIKPVDFIETLSPETTHFEKIMLGLRNVKTGIPLTLISKEKETALQELLSLHWVNIEHSRLTVTEKGCIWLDAIIKKLT